MGFTHVEFLPVAEHPFGGSWGYQVTSYYAPDLPVRQPGRLPLPGGPAAPGRHRRHHRLGARPLPAGRLGAGPVRRHRAVRARRPAARQPPGLGHAHLQLRPHRGAQLPGRQRAVLAAEFHIDGLRVDAVASMLYLDYSREAGEWMPNQYGGRENLEAVSFLQEVNATCLPARARDHDDRRGVHRLARRDPAGPPRRAGLRLQVEHGLDERHPELPAGATRSTASTTTTS